MSHSHTKIWIHVIFGTKFRQPIIHEHLRKELYDVIKKELASMKCYTKIINGTSDHVHILFILNPQKNISDIIKNIKGVTSHWINQEDFIVEKFSWQGGYGAFSVSESIIERVYQYILNQKEHHEKISYEVEMAKFLELNRLREE